MAEQGRRTVRDLRRGNRAEVVQRLYFDGPLSRQELGAATGLSSGSISNVVAELAADGLLEEAGVVESEGGRPRTLLRVAPASGHLIGIDVGETRVRVELFDLSLGELARAERPLVHHGYDIGRIVGHIREAVADVLREADVSAARLVGVGVGVPGIIDRDGPDGVVVHGQTVGWDAVPLEAMLRESAELPSWVPLFIDNGAKTLGQAEMWFGGGRGASDAVVVLFGSGVSACVVVDGELYGGADSRAVEWGHTTVRVGGRRCRCGSPGCLEAYVGAEAIRERWLESGGPPAAAADEDGPRHPARRGAAHGRRQCGRHRRCRAAGRDRRVSGGGHRRSDQPLPPRTDPGGGLGRPAPRSGTAARCAPVREGVRDAPPGRARHHRPGHAGRRRGDTGGGHSAARRFPRPRRQAPQTRCPGRGRRTCRAAAGAGELAACRGRTAMRRGSASLHGRARAGAGPAALPGPRRPGPVLRRAGRRRRRWPSSARADRGYR